MQCLQVLVQGHHRHEDLEAKQQGNPPLDVTTVHLSERCLQVLFQGHQDVQVKQQGNTSLTLTTPASTVPSSSLDSNPDPGGTMNTYPYPRLKS